MAEGIRFIEGFEKDDLFTVWESIAGWPITRSPTFARSGNYGMAPTGSLGNGIAQSPLFPPSDDIILAFAFRPVAYELGSLANVLYVASMVEPPGTQVAFLEFTPQKTFGIQVNGITRGYTNRILEGDAWYFVEWRVKRGVGTTGYCELRINGLQEFELGSINTGAAQWGGINQFTMGHIDGGNSGTTLYFDDIYVRDGNVGPPLGDREVIGIELVDDYTIEWTRNIYAKNYLTLIENTPDEEVSFNSTLTPVERKDLYEVENSPYPGIIDAVQVTSRGRKTGTDIWALYNVVHVGGVEEEGAPKSMSYPNYETYAPDVFGHQPNGSNWTLAALNAMKVGIHAIPGPS